MLFFFLAHRANPFIRRPFVYLNGHSVVTAQNYPPPYPSNYQPAHGGMLPKSKITEAIAEARGLQYPALEDCNSPPRHSAFDDPVGLMQFVQQLRELSGGKPIGFKMCIGKAEEFSALCHAMIKTGITPVSI